MTQATKKLSRKELRQPDEFVSLSRGAIDWATNNMQTVQIGVAVVVALVLLVAGIRWYLQSRDAASARHFYGASELFKREQWAPAEEAFAALAKNYGGTPYGTLAKLYAGRSALSAGHPADAIPFLKEFVEAAPSPALEQIGRVTLAHALAATKDTAGAKEQLSRAVELDGPLRPEATIELARIEESAGNKDKAIELYKKYLTDDPSGVAADLARLRLVALGATPPSTALSLPGGMSSQIQVH
jgi:hypothetical protein